VKKSGDSRAASGHQAEVERVGVKEIRDVIESHDQTIAKPLGVQCRTRLFAGEGNSSYYVRPGRPAATTVI